MSVLNASRSSHLYWLLWQDQIIDAANEPCKTIFWLVTETGIRRERSAA